MDAAAKAIERYLVRQREDGRFESQKGQFDANGQAVWVDWEDIPLSADWWKEIQAGIDGAGPEVCGAGVESAGAAPGT